MINAFPTIQPGAFSKLRQMVVERGLLKNKPTHFLPKAGVVFGMLVLSVTTVFLTTSIWIQLINAVFLAIIFMQCSFFIHDAGHRQIFGSTIKDNIVGYIAATVVGISLKEWIHHHNEHHANPNHLDDDPDLAFPFFAFSESVAAEKKGRLIRWAVRNQAWLYFVLAFFTSFSIRIGHIRAFISKPVSKTWIDMLCFGAHFALYFTMLFALLPFWYAVMFFFVHELLWGFYMGMVFAPNHKGMPVVEPGQKVDYLVEQVVTSRNMYVPRIIGFVFGGLNYQIEHHLFPHMPRWNLRKVRPLVRQFCEEQGIPYHETSILRSYWEIFSYMKHVGSFARKGMTAELLPQKQEI
jgi:fatty acid desaturase